MNVLKGLGVSTVAAAAAFALAVPAAASGAGVQRAISLSSADATYSGSIVVGSGKVKANGTIRDTGFHRGASELWISVTTTEGPFNSAFATVSNGKSYTFATRELTYPGTFVRGKATLCSWKNSGSSSVWSCGSPKSIG
ncbi:hypothetical protein ACH4SP_12195 [Streptomyces sp. NPDC021093]|uniref:hypothetical protein n=1 Tax=Streptomyces sp. NPDC021093 TaxID=3365112 RepID=UPI003791F578